MKKLDLTIVSDNVLSIQASFDRIAENLITNWNLKINDSLFTFTELEFYFFKYEIHEDNATHERKHETTQGSWRFHPQGLDIEFSTTEDSDGGILLRGIKSDNEFINGPKRVLEMIFRKMNPVAEIHNKFGLVPSLKKQNAKIYKTFRHGLSKSQDNDFKGAFYRYYTDIEQWDKKHLSAAEKERVKSNSELLNLD